MLTGSLRFAGRHTQGAVEAGHRGVPGGQPLLGGLGARGSLHAATHHVPLLAALLALYPELEALLPRLLIALRWRRATAPSANRTPMHPKHVANLRYLYDSFHKKRAVKILYLVVNLALLIDLSIKDSSKYYIWSKSKSMETYSHMQRALFSSPFKKG